MGRMKDIRYCFLFLLVFSIPVVVSVLVSIYFQSRVVEFFSVSLAVAMSLYLSVRLGLIKMNQ